MNLIVLYKSEIYDAFNLKIFNCDTEVNKLLIPKIFLLQFSISCENWEMRFLIYY